MHCSFDLLFCFVLIIGLSLIFFFFFFNDTATTEIYTLSLHDALPISVVDDEPIAWAKPPGYIQAQPVLADRKSTRLNSSHLVISYAVFCLKKKKKHLQHITPHLRPRVRSPHSTSLVTRRSHITPHCVH